MFNLTTFRKKSEEGVAMVIAILVIIVVAAVMATMTIGAITNAQQVTETRNHTYHSQAVESAVQNAIITANGSLGGCSNPEDKTDPNCIGYYTVQSPQVNWKKGKEGDIEWQWRAEAITVGEETHYDIYAIALGEAPNGDDISRALEVRLERLNVQDYTMDNRGNVNYITDVTNLFNMGLFADDEFEIQKGATLNALYEGEEVPVRVGTNGEARFSVLNTVSDSEVFNIDETVFYNVNIAGEPEDRCRIQENKGSGVGSDFLTRSEYGGQCTKHSKNKNKIELYTAYNKVVDTCLEAGAENKGSWKASTAKKNAEGNAILEAGCYNNITADRNTDVYLEGEKIPTSDKPAEVLIVSNEGKYEQSSGTNVKPAGIGNDKNSSAFQLYSAGKEFKILNTTNAIFTHDTSYTGLVAGHNLKCHSTSFRTGNTASVGKITDLNINGSLVCNQINLGTQTTINYDASLSNYGDDEGDFAIWEMGNYKNSTYDRVMNIS